MRALGGPSMPEAIARRPTVAYTLVELLTLMGSAGPAPLGPAAGEAPLQAHKRCASSVQLMVAPNDTASCTGGDMVGALVSSVLAPRTHIPL